MKTRKQIYVSSSYILISFSLSSMHYRKRAIDADYSFFLINKFVTEIKSIIRREQTLCRVPFFKTLFGMHTHISVRGVQKG